jgi:hypothetical protein
MLDLVFFWPLGPFSRIHPVSSAMSAR